MDEVGSESAGKQDGKYAESIEEYYGPMLHVLEGLQNTLAGDPPENVEGLRSLVGRIEAARLELEMTRLVRPTFAPTAASDVHELLDTQLTDRQNANEYAVGPGPFEWGVALRAVVDEWDGLDAECREDALADAVEFQEEYSVSLGYVIESFQDLIASDVQSR